MSELMKIALTNIVVDGQTFKVKREQKNAILTLLKTISISNADPFKELERELPKYSISLRGARKRLNISQKQLSKLTDIDLSNISKMENGSRKIGEKIAKKLSTVLKVNYKVFLE